MRTRWSAYAGVSVALAGGVVVKALAQRPNFYSATVYLSQSSANLMIMTNFIFVTACTLLLGLQKLLYGPLRPVEIEQLYEKAWFAVTETCLAMTIFRGEIGAWFLVMFFALLAGKVWAWIGEGRVEILEQQPPRNPRLFHTRLALSLGLSVLFDLTMLEYIVKQVMRMARPDMMVMFGFEFAVLSIVSLSTASRYAINLAEIAIVRGQKARRMDEIRRDRVAAAVRGVGESAQQEAQQEGTEAASNSPDATGPAETLVPLQAVEAARRALEQRIDDHEIEVEGWDGKGRWIFYLDLATDFFKLVIYLSFFFILLIFYGLPIHILRDVFMTFRSFFKRIGDFLRYRTATRDMNARYPDATEQDIGSEDVCIICREEMRPYHPPANGERPNPVAERMRPKKLPCGHVLHFSCLRSWLERQQICPTCRTNVVSRPLARPGQNAGGPEAPAGQHANPAPAERQGPRIYQWGPLRIGIGAARGNMMEDLQQQLGDGQPRPQQAQNGQPDGPQQYGFGIRWDGLRRRDRGERNARSIQRQLDDVQRQISHEYRALGQMTNELRLLRGMEGELARIRAQRQGGTAPTTNNAQNAGTAPPGISHPVSVTALTGNHQQMMAAGSDQLPPGLTLPEGWSMMPLHPGNIGDLPPAVAQNSAVARQAHAILGMRTQQQSQNNPLPDGQPPPPPAAQYGPNITWTPHTNRPANEHAHVQSAQTRNNSTSVPESMSRNVARSTSEDHGPHSGDVSVQTGSGAARAATSGTDGPPVASMFSLPSWGSVPMQPSVSNRVVGESNGVHHESEQSNGATKSDSESSESESVGQGQSDTPSSSSHNVRNPTVEDLVEEPD